MSVSLSLHTRSTAVNGVIWGKNDTDQVQEQASVFNPTSTCCTNVRVHPYLFLRRNKQAKQKGRAEIHFWPYHSTPLDDGPWKPCLNSQAACPKQFTSLDLSSHSLSLPGTLGGFYNCFSSINILLPHVPPKGKMGIANLYLPDASSFVGITYFFWCASVLHDVKILGWLGFRVWRGRTCQLGNRLPKAHRSFIMSIFFIFRINETKVWEVGICVVIVGVIYMKV